MCMPLIIFYMPLLHAGSIVHQLFKFGDSTTVLSLCAILSSVFIKLIMVLEAILTGRQTHLDIQCVTIWLYFAALFHLT